MNLSQKLELSSRQGYFTMIQQRSFVRCYNESAYIVTQLFGYQLNIAYDIILGMHGKIVLSCGFPIREVKKRFPQAVKTDFGYQMEGDFILTDYQHWFKKTFVDLRQHVADPHPSRRARL